MLKDIRDDDGKLLCRYDPDQDRLEFVRRKKMTTRYLGDYRPTSQAEKPEPAVTHS